MDTLLAGPQPKVGSFVAMGHPVRANHFAVRAARPLPAQSDRNTSTGGNRTLVPKLCLDKARKAALSAILRDIDALGVVI